ncbi:glutamate-cysteine ligase family protein [Dactylosporangium sp. NPDC051541]|uniref:glutamate-cysteine ligase family protein n=1 Tax=Dactylosporangium sp. NPDC051541 TaxID=3363977 RepID=UPI00378F526D
MTTTAHASVAQAEIGRIEDAEGYIASICFKTGPPASLGVEIEHLVHVADHPSRPLGAAALTALLPSRPLGPGGQVTLAVPPQPDLERLHEAGHAALDRLDLDVTRSGLRLAGFGIDPHRAPRRVLSSPRYRAMAAAFARRGGDGRTLMYSAAGLRPLLPAGPAKELPARWAAVHELGPILLALFANSPVHAGRDTGWASTRMRAWYGIDPARAGALPTGPDPAAAWARYAVRAPLLCVRRPGASWNVPAGVTFADWIGGALSRRPTFDDLDYHLRTLFPLVRPGGHLEVRYLDAQPGGDWFAPVAVLSALVSDPATVEAARDLAAPTVGRWVEAARYGLTDASIAAGVLPVADLALRVLERDGLPGPLVEEVQGAIESRFRRANML